MAPALTDSPREPNAFDAVLAAQRPDHIGRRALASVGNTHMEDDMGFQNQPNLAKDSQEMEQILVDLGSSDLAQSDLLQAIKTFESAGDTLSTGDTDAIFPLSGFDLPETVDSEGDATEDKIRQIQVRLERRCAFLERRLRILQARTIGKRISEEAAQTFDKCLRGSRKDGAARASGLKGLLKRIETTAALQASASSRPGVGPKYYRAGTSKGDASRSASIGIPSGTLTGLEDTAGALRSHLSIVKHQLDSDATLSSSGAESNDEAVSYNNPEQQPMPIEKRALWTWQKARASIASRWSWLQAQVQELDYKIRQHTDLHKQVRVAKGPVEFEGEPVAYEGPLPGSDLPDDDPILETCARVRPLKTETFKKRKLLQMHNLHTATAKAAKPADIRCGCLHPVESCAVCTGRPVSVEPLPPTSTLSAAQRLALADPGYHPVLSDIRDVPPSIHLSTLTSLSWFRSRSRAFQAPGGRRIQPPPRKLPPPLIKRSKRGRPPLSRKVKEREREKDKEDEPPTPPATVTQERPRARPSTESRHTRTNSSYDIDNIVIPQCVAANTRPEILQYKEIITPKWRVMDMPETPLNNGIAKTTYNQISDSEEEDVSEAAVRERHLRSEASERGRFVPQRPRRLRQSSAEGDASAPAPRVPPPTAPSFATPTTPRDHETVRPYTPRQFPLPEDTYVDMLSLMPDGHRLASPEQSPRPDDDESTLSPVSPMVFEGDDPDDVEWDPSREKGERRKSAYR